MTGWRDYTDLKVALRAMAHVDRLNILHQLAGRRQTTVTELVDALGLSQPLVSWHLRQLRRAGLVSTRRHGREVYCSLDAGRFRACQQALEELVAPAADAQGRAVEAPPPAPPGTAPVRSNGARSRPRARTTGLAGP